MEGKTQQESLDTLLESLNLKIENASVYQELQEKVPIKQAQHQRDLIKLEKVNNVVRRLNTYLQIMQNSPQTPLHSHHFAKKMRVLFQAQQSIVHLLPKLAEYKRSTTRQIRNCTGLFTHIKNAIPRWKAAYCIANSLVDQMITETIIELAKRALSSQKSLLVQLNKNVTTFNCLIQGSQSFISQRQLEKLDLLTTISNNQLLPIITYENSKEPFQSRLVS